MDLSDDRTAVIWAQRVLQDAPPHAILLTDQDRHTFTLWYFDEIGDHTDLTIIDIDLWAQEPYRRMITDELELDTKSVQSIKDVKRLSSRPVIPVIEITSTNEEAP
jgi:hypothetical protein